MKITIRNLEIEISPEELRVLQNNNNGQNTKKEIEDEKDEKLKEIKKEDEKIKEENKKIGF